MTDGELETVAEPETTGSQGRRLTIARGALLALFALTIWRYGWMADDGLLTVRSALNWVHGGAPQFNVDERVINYTHPLWFVMVAAAGAVTGSWAYSIIYLSIVLATTAAAIVLWLARSMWQVLLVGAGLLLSNAIVDFSTSGLEGPLAMLLVATAFWLRVHKPERQVAMGITGGLLLLCRLDYAVLILPVAAAMAIEHRHRARDMVRLAAGFLAPLAIWAVASWSYYSAVLPATFQAKTNSVIGRGELVGRGLEYVQVSLGFDPVLLGIAGGIGLLVLRYGDWWARAWILGCGLYGAYIVWVGGDYMIGRFWAVPAFVVVSAITRLPAHLSSDRLRPRSAPAVSFVAVLAIGLSVVALGLIRSDFTSANRASSLRLDDPRIQYFSDERPGWSGLGRGLDPFGQIVERSGYIPSSLQDAEDQSQAWDAWDGQATSIKEHCHGAGQVGLFVGPGTQIVDPCALSDVFLGSLAFDPATDMAPGTKWKAGHFTRTLPEGYLEAFEARDPYLVRDPELADRLAHIWDRIRPREGTWVR